LVVDTDRNEVKNIFDDFDSTIELEEKYTWDFISDREEQLTLEADVQSFVSSDQTIVRIHFDNVSLRNRVIETLKKKTGSLQDLLESHDEFVLKFKKDENGNIYCSFVSDTFQSITGLSQQEILDKGIESVVSKETAGLIKKNLIKAFDGTLCSDKCDYIGKNGETVTMVQSFKPVINGTNNKVQAVKSVALLELKTN